RPVGLQLRERKPEVQVALHVERGHAGVVWIVEPGTGSQPAAALFTGIFGHSTVHRFTPRRCMEPGLYSLRSRIATLNFEVRELSGGGLTALHGLDEVTYGDAFERSPFGEAERTVLIVIENRTAQHGYLREAPARGAE